MRVVGNSGRLQGVAATSLIRTYLSAHEGCLRPLWLLSSRSHRQILGGYRGRLPSGNLPCVFDIVHRLRHRILNAVHHVSERIQQMLKPDTVSLLAGAAKDAVRSRAHLVAENALLRHQLIILHRQVKRPELSNRDRLRLLLLARATPFRKQALLIVQPDTLLRWHRQLFRLVWRRKSRPETPQARITPETIALIKQMRSDNVTWGAERIRGELLKLGIKVSKRTVQCYLTPGTAPSTSPANQNWGTFLRNHADQIWSCDFTQTYNLIFAPLFVFVIIELSSRRIVHTAVTAHPTDAWVAQQLREATPWAEHPRFLIRDNDKEYGPHFAAVAAGSGREVIRTTHPGAQREFARRKVSCQPPSRVPRPHAHPQRASLVQGGQGVRRFLQSRPPSSGPP